MDDLNIQSEFIEDTIVVTMALQTFAAKIVLQQINIKKLCEFNSL